MKILSFIIPSYNCEKFLEKCVSSFLDTNVLYKLDIIIVDDGSTDSTAEIADGFVARFPNSVRAIHQPNRGHGGAINAGAAVAEGKYLKVIDADDWVETQNLPAFIDKLEHIDSDVILTHNYTYNICDGAIKKWMCYPNKFDVPYSISNMIEQWGSFARSFTFHGITYKTDFYKKSGYMLSEKVFYEDHEHSTFPAHLAKSVTPIDMFIYDYRIGDVNQSVSDNNSLARLGHMETVIERFINEYKSASDDVAKDFICKKCKILFVSYLSVCLLVKPREKQYRDRANNKMKFIKEQMPSLYNIVIKKYRVFKFLSVLGINKRKFDKFISSKTYLKLKGAKDFE